MIQKPYKLASGQLTHGRPSVLEIAGRRVGGPHFALIAGPCTVESRAQTIVTEVMDARDLKTVLEVADVIQIGARNMQNYALLTEIGRSGCRAMPLTSAGVL